MQCSVWNYATIPSPALDLGYRPAGNLHKRVAAVCRVVSEADLEKGRLCLFWGAEWYGTEPGVHAAGKGAVYSCGPGNRALPWGRHSACCACAVRHQLVEMLPAILRWQGGRHGMLGLRRESHPSPAWASRCALQSQPLLRVQGICDSAALQSAAVSVAIGLPVAYPALPSRPR